MKNYDPRALLKARCFNSTQAAVAKELGITAAYLSDILAHRREPGPRVLKALGISKRVVYEKSAGSVA